MVTVYSSPTCAYCHMAMHYFDSKHVKYTEKDISMDREAMDWVYNHVGQLATPVIDIDGITILGFDRSKIDEALRAKKLV